MTDATIDLVLILDMLETFLKRFVVTGAHQLAAATLWVAHTYTLDAFDVTPRLAITSPGRRTGKTRFLEVLGMLVRNPMMTSSVSPSVLFRTIDAGPTTVLFDEVDAVFGRRDGNEDLRALLNAGSSEAGRFTAPSPTAASSRRRRSMCSPRWRSRRSARCRTPWPTARSTSA